MTIERFFYININVAMILGMNSSEDKLRMLKLWTIDCIVGADMRR